jgi:cGMP-dependent protein kinase
MAPEVLLGKGYGYSADIWSLGIMVYEFICGEVPFGEELSDTWQVYD